MTLPSQFAKNRAVPLKLLSLSIISSLALLGCRDDHNESVYIDSAPETISTLSPEQVDQAITMISPTGKAVTPAAKCGVVVEKISYQTQGSAGEATTATAALMLPAGTSADCQGKRPVLLHAHGTTAERNYDFTQVGNPKNSAAQESTLIAANFAAQGYIVVAPNYAGYDKSELSYHPYLNADQQSGEMVTALDTARQVLSQQQYQNNPNYREVSASELLFLSGYSQGGHVAMATARRLQSQNRPVTAIAPSSGPYALAAFGDAIFSGTVNVGSTVFAPLIARGLQPANPKIYSQLSEVFNAPYEQTLLPSADSLETLFKSGKLPQTALFQSAPTGIPALDPVSPAGKFGFADKNYLIKSDFRARYLVDAQANPDPLLAKTGLLPSENPQNELRKSLKANDLRGFAPLMPTLLCGGNLDPTVFYDLNTGSMTAILQQLAQTSKNNLNVTVLDVDASNQNQRPNNSVLALIGAASTNPWQLNEVVDRVQLQFARAVEATNKAAFDQATNSGAGTEDAEKLAQATVLSKYHGTLVSSACTQATREFFDQNFVRPQSKAF